MAVALWPWLRRIGNPFRRAWSLTFNRSCKRNKTRGGGLWKLYSEVTSCSYEDVHVMWSILHKSEAFKPPIQKSRFSRMHSVK